MGSMVSIIGIIVALVVMMFLSFKGVSIYLYAPASAIIVMLTSGLPIWDTLTGPYMVGFVGYAQSFFLLFMFASIYAKVMGDSGAAQVIATTLTGLASKAKKNPKFVAMLCLQSVTLLLTYGGINLFVVVFLQAAIGKSMFQKLDIPWHLYNAGAWASGTITMTMLPGTPASQNLIPMQYLGTTPTAAPILGLLSAIICVILELFYIRYALKKTEKKGEGFLPTGAVIAERIKEVDLKQVDIGIVKALIPSIVLLLVLNAKSILGIFMDPIPTWIDLPGMQLPLVALTIGVILAIILYRKNLPNIMQTLAGGAEQSIGVVISVCAVVGFGSVVAITSGYESVITGLDSLPGSPLIQLLIATNVCAGFAGSASGGLAIGLNSFAQKFLDMGINPQHIHRIAAIGCGGLDSLPHNGAVNSGLRVAGLTHKQAYKHTFIECCVIPIIVSVFSIIFATMGIV
ncbi:GntP family permease [Ruminococcaceae bacterium OttesenSCG-928-O06]|nr:GntP family permease [Ruminococcaceae bacterium OttesenSCG-928-O06]